MYQKAIKDLQKERTFIEINEKTNSGNILQKEKYESCPRPKKTNETGMEHILRKRLFSE